MKRIAKFFSGLLSAAIAFNFAAPAVNQAMAADDTIASMSEVIMNGFKNYDTVIDISKFDIGIDINTGAGSERVTEVISYVLKVPEMFCVDVNSRISIRPVRGLDGNFIIGYVNVTYDNTKEEADALLSEVNAKIDEVVSENIKDGMTELDKALVLHDYIVLNTVYDTKSEIPDRDNGASAYDILVCGNGVCEGYAQAYNMLLDRVGISSIMVTSYEMNHAWNLVNIDNEWYHVDSTWDDPVPDAQGRVNHKYFLLSDDAISKSDDIRAKAHVNWDSRGLTAVSDKYDNAFWETVGTEIFVRGDKWYYVSNEGAYSTYTESTGETSAYVSICEDKWYEWGSTSSYWLGKYSSLIISGDKVVFNTPTEIYKMNLDGSEKRFIKYINPYEVNGYAYGLRVSGDKLYAVIKQDPKDAGELYEIIDLAELALEENYSFISSLLEVVSEMKDGDSYSFDMQDTEMILPAAAIDNMRNRNIQISLNLSGYSWNINGTDVTTEEAQDLNLEIKQDQGIIPQEMIATVSGSHTQVVELNLQHDGPFGLQAGIDYSLGQEYRDNVAVVYYYNEANSTMDKIDYMMVDTNGNLQVELDHASSYAVVLRDLNAPDDPIIEDEEKPPESSDETVEPSVTTAPEEITVPETSETTITGAMEVTEPEETTITGVMDVTEPEEEIVTGDINGDGKVDITDLSLLSLACMNEIQFTETQISVADVTRDGLMNLADLACMKQFLMNVITEF